MSYLERFSLRDKVILLTGGAGLYGRGLAADLAAAGATLVLAARDVAKSRSIRATRPRSWPCAIACWRGMAGSTGW